MISTFLVTTRMKMLTLTSFISTGQVFALETGDGVTMVLSDPGVKKQGLSRNTVVLVLVLVPVLGRRHVSLRISR